MSETKNSQAEGQSAAQGTVHLVLKVYSVGQDSGVDFVDVWEGRG